jgi:hypothetical protein
LRDRVAGDKASEILRSLAELVGQLGEATGTFRRIVAASANGRLHDSSLSLDLSGSNGSAVDPVSLLGVTLTYPVERSPLSLEKLSIQDDIVTYTTKDGKVGRNRKLGRDLRLLFSILIGAT